MKPALVFCAGLQSSEKKEKREKMRNPQFADKQPS